MIRMEMNGRDEVIAKLRAVSSPETRTAILDDLGNYLVNEAISRFENEQAPDGTGWKKSHRAETTGGKTLTLSGLLRDSITHEVSAARLEVGTAKKEAAIHQFGGEIKPKSADALAFRIGGHLILAKKVTMPARPFLGFTDADETEAVNIIHDHWSGALQ